MKLNVSYNYPQGVGDIDAEIVSNFRKMISPSLGALLNSDINKQAIDRLLLKVETNKKGLFGKIELWDEKPKIENTIALVCVFNKSFVEENDYRLLNASLKLLDLLMEDYYESIPQSFWPILKEEIDFILSRDFAL